MRPEHVRRIEAAVQVAHKVATLTLDFVKLYVLHCHHNGIDLPVLDKNFYLTVIRVVSKSSGG
eukprot:44664-Eustigmatos_ZCMA.PRE.1